LQRTWSSLTLGTTPLNGNVVGQTGDQMIYGVIGVALVALVLVVARRHASAPILIKSPSLGVLNLTSTSDSVSAADVQILAPYFSEVRQSVEAPPRCDVLLLYGDLDSTGAIKGSTRRLREVIRDAGAAVVIVATEHPVENYIAGAPQTGFGQANLVMTLGRKGPVLAEFLARLFAQMKQGVTMPVAWNSLAPPIPGVEQKEVPETVFACERGPVAFG
jgi:hypothetical protein